MILQEIIVGTVIYGIVLLITATALRLANLSSKKEEFVIWMILFFSYFIFLGSAFTLVGD